MICYNDISFPLTLFWLEYDDTLVRMQAVLFIWLAVGLIFICNKNSHLSTNGLSWFPVSGSPLAVFEIKITNEIGLTATRP